MFKNKNVYFEVLYQCVFLKIRRFQQFTASTNAVPNNYKQDDIHKTLTLSYSLPSVYRLYNSSSDVESVERSSFHLYLSMKPCVWT